MSIINVRGFNKGSHTALAPQFNQQSFELCIVRNISLARKVLSKIIVLWMAAFWMDFPEVENPFAPSLIKLSYLGADVVHD